MQCHLLSTFSRALDSNLWILFIGKVTLAYHEIFQAFSSHHDKVELFSSELVTYQQIFGGKPIEAFLCGMQTAEVGYWLSQSQVSILVGASVWSSVNQKQIEQIEHKPGPVLQNISFTFDH